MALYAMAITGRFGLGHGLLAWGRSVVWAEIYNAMSDNEAKHFHEIFGLRDRCRRILESGILSTKPLPFYKRWGNMFVTRTGLKLGLNLGLNLAMGYWYFMKKTRVVESKLGFDEPNPHGHNSKLNRR
jgi:hypothetical protein